MGKMKRISYSQLSMYSNCPYQWYRQYVLKDRPEPSSIYLVFGTSMHTVLQTYLKTMYDQTVESANKLDLAILLKEELAKNFLKTKEKTGKLACNQKTLEEFYQDGLNIIDFFKKKRAEHFRKNGYKLIGCEVKIDVELNNNIKWIGYLDVVIKDTYRNVIKIYDIKTSTFGWKKKDKSDKNKTQQLLLYKQFYSKQYNHPIDKIEVEYLIVKRKLYKNVAFPQKRIQTFSPSSGKPSMNKVGEKLKKFISEAFDKNGEHVSGELPKTPSKNSCRWCLFLNTNKCLEGIR